MLYWTTGFFIGAIVAGVLGFGGLAGAAAGIAELLFFICLLFVIISLVAGTVRPPSSDRSSDY